MNVTCADRERIFMDGTREEWAALEGHAATCAECGEELRIWKRISTTAGELKLEWETPYLWKKIERGLAEQMAEKPSRWRAWLNSSRMAGFHWQTAAAMALLIVVTGTAAWIYFRPPQHPENEVFLKNISEVERAEVAYEKAIDKLAREAKPDLGAPTPLMASYREKLLVLDSAIAELREEAGQNPANAHLRNQLLAMYREKQETLEEVLEAKR